MIAKNGHICPYCRYDIDEVRIRVSLSSSAPIIDIIYFLKPQAK